jgi:hypothetical protein
VSFQCSFLLICNNKDSDAVATQENSNVAAESEELSTQDEKHLNFAAKYCSIALSVQKVWEENVRYKLDLATSSQVTVITVANYV